MRHHNSVRKFGRNKNQRRALLAGLATSFIEHGQITTTAAKAKELRPLIEKLITKAKTPTLSNRRLILARLMNQAAETTKLIDDIAPNYKTRTGGYTRIIKLPQRKSDGAPLAVIQLV